MEDFAQYILELQKKAYTQGVMDAVSAVHDTGPFIAIDGYRTIKTEMKYKDFNDKYGQSWRIRSSVLQVVLKED